MSTLIIVLQVQRHVPLAMALLTNCFCVDHQQREVVVKRIKFVQRHGEEDEQTFLERAGAEITVPIVLRKDEDAAPHVVECLGGCFTTKDEVLTAIIVMERCPMTLRDWLHDHQASLTVSYCSCFLLLLVQRCSCFYCLFFYMM